MTTADSIPWIEPSLSAKLRSGLACQARRENHCFSNCVKSQDRLLPNLYRLTMGLGILNYNFQVCNQSNN